MCGRVIQSSGPRRYAIVDGMNVRDSRVHNYPPRWDGAPSHVPISASAHPGQGGWRPPIQGAPELWDFCNARQIFFSSHIADRFSCSAVTKLQQTEAGE
jgi:hypothetical protein